MIYKNTSPQPSIGPLQILRWKLSARLNQELPNPVIDSSANKPCAPDLTVIHNPNPASIQATWIGHSSFLLQHRGRNLLTDPIFGDCHTPIPGIRLRRAEAPGLTIEQLPQVHDVLISHNHYDHLDAPTVRRLVELQPTIHFWVPSGLAQWFRRRGITAVRELDWGESAELDGDTKLHAVPAQHFSARGPFDRNRTHWCGWVLRSGQSKIYFAGDTGYSSDFSGIANQFGGMDLSLLPIGAYSPRWIMRSVHVDPEEAVQIHEDVQSRCSIGSHWGTFRLTDEPLNEPPALLKQELAARGLDERQFRVLQPGATFALPT